MTDVQPAMTTVQGALEMTANELSRQLGAGVSQLNASETISVLLDCCTEARCRFEDLPRGVRTVVEDARTRIRTNDPTQFSVTYLIDTIMWAV